MSATDELRRLLDERGVEWWQSANTLGCVFTRWHSPLFGDEVCAMENGEEGLVLFDHFMTPEQAIAATLGDADATCARQVDAGTCHDTHEARWFRCSACGFGIEDMYVNDEDEYPPEDQPRYCPNCGRLVVEVDA